MLLSRVTVLLALFLFVPSVFWVNGQTETIITVPATTNSGGSGGGAGAEYQLLSDIPGLEAVPVDGNFSAFINAIYTMAIGIGSALAVLMIIYVGVKYATSTIAGVKADLKAQLSMIVGGLVLLLGAFVFLSVINPRLTDYSDLGRNFTDIDYTGVTGYDTDVFELDPDYYLFVPNPEEFPEIWVFESVGTYGQMFESREACEEAAAVGGETCTIAGNPAITPDLVYDPVVPSDDELIIMSATDGRLNSNIPYNPSRTFRDFASKGDGSLKIARSVILNDAYIQAMFLTRFGHGLRLVSGYRDPAHNSAVGSTANNHPLGYSLDYGTRELNQEELFFLQELIQATGAVRVGWGAFNNAGTHVQWNDGVNTPFVYWCYSGTPGPFKGPGSMPNFAKGRSCDF